MKTGKGPIVENCGEWASLRQVLLEKAGPGWVSTKEAAGNPDPGMPRLRFQHHL